MTDRQFFDCRFPMSAKVYCYHHDGPEKIGVGDKVDVATDRGEITIEVVQLRDGAPKRTDGETITTKAIARLFSRADAVENHTAQ